MRVGAYGGGFHGARVEGHGGGGRSQQRWWWRQGVVRGDDVDIRLQRLELVEGRLTSGFAVVLSSLLLLGVGLRGRGGGVVLSGNRVFGALKGALDGGLDIPHSDERFAGFGKDSKQLDAETLTEDEPEKYQSHFSEYIKRGIEAYDMEALYKKVHDAIRADPTVKKSEKQPPKTHKRFNANKLAYEERKAKLVERLNKLNAAVGAADDDDEEDDYQNISAS
ncbi:hypothetical protein vseg_020997 [Gypsophila vaccaria]